MSDALTTAALVVLVKDVIVAGVNFAFWWHSPDDWVAFCEARPRAAAIIKIVRSLGIEPKRMLVSLKELAEAKSGPRK